MSVISIENGDPENFKETSSRTDLSGDETGV